MTPDPITAVLLADSSESPILGWLVLAALAVGYVLYLWVLRSGMRPRTVVTSLSETQITEIFVAKVAGMGWHLTDWYTDDPDGRLVAESSLLAGIRQQIGLSITTDPRHPGKLVARVRVLRYSKKVFGGPTKAHTLRLRLSGFAAGVRRLDPGALVTIGATAPIPSNKPTMPSPMPAPVVPLPSTHTITPVGGSPVLPAPAVVAPGMAMTRPAVAPTLAAPMSMWPGTGGGTTSGWSGPSRHAEAAAPAFGSVGLKGSLSRR